MSADKQSAASRMAAARLERSQIRADAAKKTSSSSQYGSFYGDLGRPGDGENQRPSRFEGLERSKSLDFSGAGSSADPTMNFRVGAPSDDLAEIGVPCVQLCSSEAFCVASKEGALHENHDRGGATVLQHDGSTILFACLDGHGAEGAAVSGYALRNLLAGAASALAAGKSPSDAVHFAFARTSATMVHNVSDCRFSGSTAILTVLQHTDKGRVLTTGWVGDSRAVVARAADRARPAASRSQQQQTAYMPVPLTKDHKPTDPKERTRLAEARAIVRPSRVINPHTGAWLEVGAVRVWDASQIYGVAMSRSLGDLQVHPFLIPTPEVSSRLLDDKDRLLILATDGVWDVMDNDEAVDAATSAAPAVACAEIVEKCAKRWDTSMPGRRDDITTVVVDLSHPDCNMPPLSSANDSSTT